MIAASNFNVEEKMRNLRELADNKILAFPGGDPEAYLADRIEKDWPRGQKQMELLRLKESDINSDLVEALRQEGRAKLNQFIEQELLKKADAVPKAVKGFAGQPSPLKFSKTYRYWDMSQDYKMSEEDRKMRIQSEDFTDNQLVGVLITAIRGGLIVHCEIDVEPHTHVWRESSGVVGAHAQKLLATDQHVPISGKIILR